MAKQESQAEVTSEWPGFPDAADAVPLGGIGFLVEAATHLAEPGSHAAPAGIEELTGAAQALAPPETPVGDGAADVSAPDDAGAPSVSVAENPLDGIEALVDLATHLAPPEGHAAPGDIADLIALAKALAPPETPVGDGPGDFAVTEDGVPLGAGAEHAMDAVDQANPAAELDMELIGDVVFLTTVGINNLPDAAFHHG